MGMPNMNFPIKRLSKMMFINLVQEHKTREEENYFIKYKDKYINESLLDFSKKEKNSFLSELIHNLLNFRKKCLKQKKLDNKERINIAANYLLFHKIEKCLIEISYMSNKQHRDNKIELLYNWYKNILNKNKTLKIIKSKLFKYDNEKINLNDENKTTSNKNLETKGEIINTIIKNKEETNIDKNKEDKTNSEFDLGIFLILAQFFFNAKGVMKFFEKFFLFSDISDFCGVVDDKNK